MTIFVIVQNIVGIHNGVLSFLLLCFKNFGLVFLISEESFHKGNMGYHLMNNYNLHNHHLHGEGDAH